MSILEKPKVSKKTNHYCCHLNCFVDLGDNALKNFAYETEYYAPLQVLTNTSQVS